MRYSPYAAAACESLRKREAKALATLKAAEKLREDRLKLEIAEDLRKGQEALAKCPQPAGMSDEDYLMHLFLNP